MRCKASFSVSQCPGGSTARVVCPRAYGSRETMCSAEGAARAPATKYPSVITAWETMPGSRPDTKMILDAVSRTSGKRSAMPAK
jgi:hypothetical protein